MPSLYYESGRRLSRHCHLPRLNLCTLPYYSLRSPNRGMVWGQANFWTTPTPTTHANSSSKIVVISIIGNNNGTTARRKNKEPKKKQKKGKIAFFISVYVFSAQSQLPGVSSDSACCVLSCTRKNKVQKNKLIFKRHIATLGTPRRKEPEFRTGNRT